MEPRSRSARVARRSRHAAPTAALLALVLTAAAAAGQEAGVVRGTVYAPSGEDVHGAVIVACFAENGRCNYATPHPNSRAVRIDTRGASARYVFRDLLPGEYVVLGTRDTNGNGAEDDGDWIAQYADLRPVRPPAQGIDMHFTVKAPAVPPTAPPPDAVLPARRSPPAVPAPLGPGGPRLDGLYGRTATGGTVGFGAQLTTTYIGFFPDGRYIWGLYPREGLHQLDWDHWCARDGWSCGTYQVEQLPGSRPGRVALSGGTGRAPETIQIAGSADDRFVTVFEPRDRLDGLRLGSRYAADCHNGFQAVIEFSRDGGFAERGLLGCVHWPSHRGSVFDDHADYSARAQLIQQRPGGSGRYTIERNTLELRYSDGRTVRLGIHVPSGVRPGVDPPEICPVERCLPRVQGGGR